MLSPAGWCPEPCCTAGLWWQCEAAREKRREPEPRTCHLLYRSPPPHHPTACSSRSCSERTTRGSQGLRMWMLKKGEHAYNLINRGLYLLSGLQVYSAHISVVRLPAVHNSHDHLIAGQGALLSCFLLSGQRCSLLHQKVFRWSARKQLREKERVYERWSEHYTHSILIKVIYESLWCCVLILQTPGVVWLWCIHPHTRHWRVQDPELHTPSPCAAGMLVSPLCWTADKKKTENFNHRKS